MKHEESNLLTKMALALSLKKHMSKKSLKKITVSEIITDCNLNRKTFYYHFEDIYALLKWMLEQEAINVVKQFDLLVDYYDAITFVIDYVETNAHILHCAYDSMGREELKRFFCTDFRGIVFSLISSVEKEIKVSANEEFKEFLCIMYTEALAGMLINWLTTKEKKDREKTIDYLYLVLKSSLPAVLRNGENL